MIYAQKDIETPLPIVLSEYNLWTNTLWDTRGTNADTPSEVRAHACLSGADCNCCAWQASSTCTAFPCVISCHKVGRHAGISDYLPSTTSQGWS